MAAKAKPGNDIYQLRAVLRGIGPLVWRRLLVRADSSVADLHEVLQVAFGWEDMRLNRFGAIVKCCVRLVYQAATGWPGAIF